MGVGTSKWGIALAGSHALPCSCGRGSQQRATGTGKCVCMRPVQELYTSRSAPTPGPSVPWTWLRRRARSVSSTPAPLVPGGRMLRGTPQARLCRLVKHSNLDQFVSLPTPTHPPCLFLTATFCSRGHLCTHLEAEQTHGEWLHRGGCGEGAEGQHGAAALSSPLSPRWNTVTASVCPTLRCVVPDSVTPQAAPLL